MKGRLLVATPDLEDVNFFRTVVLIVEHGDEGTAGIVLNRPSDTAIARGPLDEWSDLAADPPLVFVGGPVAPGAAVCLARRRPDGMPVGFQHVVGGLGVLDLATGRDDVRASVDRLRIFVGYAGWEVGQLDSEIAEGAWYTLDADPDDALSSHPGTLWRSVLRRQGGRLALVSNFPPDPTLN